jgi:hypothetical protein
VCIIGKCSPLSYNPSPQHNKVFTLIQSRIEFWNFGEQNVSWRKSPKCLYAYIILEGDGYHQEWGLKENSSRTFLMWNWTFPQKGITTKFVSQKCSQYSCTQTRKR